MLAHRQHYRKSERTRTERLWKSRSDSVLVEPDDLFCVQNARALAQGLLDAIDLLPTKLVRKLQRLRINTLDADERLASIEKWVGCICRSCTRGLRVRGERPSGVVQPSTNVHSSGADFRLASYWPMSTARLRRGRSR